jgi:DNA-binding SARP family transcriptional activator
MGVFRLRRALAPLDAEDGSRLRTVSGGYLLRVGQDELDTDVFADEARDGRRALEEGDPARASELLADALRLWRGPPLAEVAFEDFAQTEIRRLEELRLITLEARIDADLQLGRNLELIPELEGLLARQPTRERIAGQLITALYGSGRQADALEVYQRTRTHLAEQLGLEPGPVLKGLQRQVLEHGPALTTGVPPRHAGGHPLPQAETGYLGRPSRQRVASPPLPATPTIGRQPEVQHVSHLLADRDVRLATLTGPGGVGKTRLALVVAKALEHEFENGVCWVELSGVTRPEDVGSTLVRTLDATPTPGEDTTSTLVSHLASSELLLVLDNFEHVLEAAGLVSELLALLPRLTVLATSREPLNLAAEHRVLVTPLAPRTR